MVKYGVSASSNINKANNIKGQSNRDYGLIYKNSMLIFLIIDKL